MNGWIVRLPAYVLDSLATGLLCNLVDCVLGCLLEWLVRLRADYIGRLCG